MNVQVAAMDELAYNSPRSVTIEETSFRQVTSYQQRNHPSQLFDWRLCDAVIIMGMVLDAVSEAYSEESYSISVSTYVEVACVIIARGHSRGTWEYQTRDRAENMC
ncbi:hypothetical protein GQ457_15G016440 [Hibiscus cannabinus]